MNYFKYIKYLFIYVVIQFGLANQKSFANGYKSEIRFCKPIIKDSVIITTNAGNQYVGVISKKVEDGYFLIVNKREIYIAEFEVKSIVEIKKETNNKEISNPEVSLFTDRDTTIKEENIVEIINNEEKPLVSHSELDKKNRISLKRPKSLTRRAVKISNPKIKKGIVIGSVLGGAVLFIQALDVSGTILWLLFI